MGGRPAGALAEEFGTPLVAYCERTVLAAAHAYLGAAPGALVLYGVKAFANVALLRLLAGEGLGADVSTLGELEYGLRAGVPGERLVVHGNNKSDDELRAAVEAGVRFVVLDALDEVERAAAAGVERVLVRVTPGIEADTHPAIRTAHHGSKFGLPPDQALEAIAAARNAGFEVAGLHLHIGSQLLDTQAARTSVDWLGGFAAECSQELGWAPEVVDLGGGLGIDYAEGDHAPAIADFVTTLLQRLEQAWTLHGLTRPQVILEPGRSLVGRAGVTLYRVGVDRLRQALRVRRRPDRERFATRAAARRSAGRSRNRRLHPRDGLELQRRPAARGSAGRRRPGPPDPPTREHRRRSSPRRDKRLVSLRVMLSSFWVASTKPGAALVRGRGWLPWQGRGWFLAPRDRGPEAGMYCPEGH